MDKWKQKKRAQGDRGYPEGHTRFLRHLGPPGGIAYG